MDIREIRRLNLEALVKEHGTAAKLAEAVESTESYLSQIKNGIKTPSGGTFRSMGNDLARRIEKKLGKGSGWMDVLHLSVEDEYILNALRALPEDVRADIAKKLRQAVDDYKASLGDALTASVSNPGAARRKERAMNRPRNRPKPRKDKVKA